MKGLTVRRDIIEEPKKEKVNKKTSNSIDLLKEEISNTFCDLEFEEESHSYTLDGQKLISTSKFISKFYTEPFDAFNIAKAMADSYNKKSPTRKRDAFYYIYRWNQIKETATNSGSRVHNYAEYNYPEFYDAPICKQEQGVIDFFNDLPDNYVVLFMELKMYIREYKKAGTADLILYNTETDNIVISDYKTNKVNMHQYYNGKTLKGSFSHLPSCALNKYSIQFSDYQNMIEMNTRFKVEDRWLIHLSDNDINEIDMGKDPNKYDLDLSLLPKKETNTYRVYSTPDYTDILKQDYKLLL